MKNPSFAVFDIENFCLSISSELFNKTIKFASENCTISENNLSVIMQSRQTLLFHDKQPWVKKNRNRKLWCPHGLSWWSWILWTSWMLYLKQPKHCHEKETCSIIPRWRSRYYEKYVRNRKKIFKDCDLNISIKTNLKSMDFLHIRLHLRDNTYQTYRKPNS